MILRLLDESKRVPARADEHKDESSILTQSDHWASGYLRPLSRAEWAIAYLCREGWEPFAADGFVYFRRAVEA